MKTLVLIIAIFGISFTAQAQKTTATPVLKIEVVKTLSTDVVNKKEVNLSKTSLQLARVHKNKNYKIVKALRFTTKKKSLMA